MPLTRPLPLPPPAPHSPAEPAAQQRARVIAAVQAAERAVREPLSAAELLMGRWLRGLTGLTRTVAGAGRWVQGVYPCTVLSVNASARTCSVRLLESGGLVSNVQYGTTAPTVGGEYAARRIVQLNPLQLAGGPQEVGWSLKVPSGAWLYWIALPATQDAASVGTLSRTAWPLADPPVIEAVATFPYPDPGVSALSLLGIDGLGTVYAVAVGSLHAGREWVYTRGDYGAGSLATHVLPAAVAPDVGVPGHDRMVADALATRPGVAGVLLGHRLSSEVAENPGIGADEAHNPTVTYYRSDDAGDTWTALYSQTHDTLTWEDQGGGVYLAHTQQYHAPTGPAWGWLAADSAEATSLGVGVEGLAYLFAARNDLGVDQAVVPPPYSPDWELVGNSGVAVYAAATSENSFPNGDGLAAGLRADGAWVVLRYTPAASPPFTTAWSLTGPAGPWNSPPADVGPNAFTWMLAQDRAFLNALGINYDNTTGDPAGVVTIDGGVSWQAFTAGQTAALLAPLQSASPTTIAGPGFIGGGWIGEAP